MRKRTGFISQTRRGNMRNPSWQGRIVVDGKIHTRQRKSYLEVLWWLEDIIREHPYVTNDGRPRKRPKPDHVVVLETCRTLRRRWRPDLVHELIHGWDPRDIARELGWTAERTRKALDRCVEKELLDMHPTPVGRGEGQRMERLYTRHRATYRAAQTTKGMYNIVI